MLNTFVVYVENKPGVLTRVASLFRRRAFNIDSLTVGRTEKPEVSRMTITVDADYDQARRIEANLYKLVNVLLVENITNEPSIVRDLAMIKVGATHEARSHVLELASVFRARVVDVAPESLTIEITGGDPPWWSRRRARLPPTWSTATPRTLCETPIRALQSAEEFDGGSVLKGRGFQPRRKRRKINRGFSH